MTTVIASGVALNPTFTNKAPGFRPIGRVGDGTILALGQAASAAIHLYTSSDGVTWSDRGVLPDFDAGISMADIMHIGVYSDVLWIWVRDGFPTGGTYPFHSWHATWDGTTPLAGPTVATYHWLTGGISNPFSPWSFAACRIGSVWHIACIPQDGIPQLPAVVGQAGSTPSTVTRTIWGATPAMCAVGGALYAAWVDYYRGSVCLAPITSVGTVDTLSAIEPVATGTEGFPSLDLVPDNAGFIDVLFSVDDATIQTTKRTATATYGAITVIGSIMPGMTRFSASHDAATDDLWVVYPSAVSQPNGELYARVRRSGVWLPAYVLDGGDASGYNDPSVSPFGATGADVTYIKGEGPYDLAYLLLAGGSAPSKPTGLTTGYVVGPDPVLSATYVNRVPTDHMQYRQVQVYADAGMSTLVEDTGQIAANSSSWTYTGTALTYGTAYWWRERYWDSVTGSGAGTPSPWSDLTTITPVRGGTISITDVTSAGLTSLTTLYAGTFRVDATWTHPDGHASSAYTLLLWSADGTTLLGTYTASFGVDLASGASFISDAWAAPVVNGTSVNLQVAMTDSDTGLVSTGDMLLLAVAFVPPPAPSGVAVVTIPDLGKIEMHYTPVDTDAAYALIRRRATGTGAWTVLAATFSVDGPQTVDLHPAPNQSFDYAVATVDSHGRTSAWTAFNEVVLEPTCGHLGFLLNAVDDPDGAFVPLGIIADQWSAISWDQKEDRSVWVPTFATLPRSSWGPTKYREGTQFKFVVPYADYLSDGTPLYGRDIIATLFAMGQGRLLYFRDVKGKEFYVELWAMHEEVFEDQDDIVTFSLTLKRPPTVPFV